MQQRFQYLEQRLLPFADVGEASRKHTIGSNSCERTNCCGHAHPAFHASCTSGSPIFGCGEIQISSASPAPVRLLKQAQNRRGGGGGAYLPPRPPHRPHRSVQGHSWSQTGSGGCISASATATSECSCPAGPQRAAPTPPARFRFLHSTFQDCHAGGIKGPPRTYMHALSQSLCTLLCALLPPQDIPTISFNGKNYLNHQM